MPWTAPRTWVTAEVPPASTFNTHVRDNLAWLGTDKPSCRVFHSANVSIADATLTAQTFDSERFDVAGMHSTSVNPTRLTVPAGAAGLWLIGGNLAFAGAANGERIARIRLNGATEIASQGIIGGAANSPNLEVTTLYRLSAADYVELIAFQSSGGAINSTANANRSPEFWAVWMAT